MAEHVWLLPLKDLDDDARAIKLGEIAELDVLEGQRTFVGDPLRMMLIGLEEDSRHPFAIDANGSAVGVLTLQTGAATLAGWADDDSVWLLRGFLIDRRQQGKGLGTLAAEAAVRAAAKLTAALGGGQAGVVLSVNEHNPAGQAAYRKAGFEDRGQYLGGDAGPQRTMYRPF
ncbi:MAG: GNAT family N-acetyltransferase [Arthrobacter sp.]|nr:GNAT family N-acetyltransferase [Arthrobacter sp.]MDZ4353393.1 GNAT family N-acetyltransferase [Arthrobacter sp.]